jgi:hypothetical protein
VEGEFSEVGQGFIADSSPLASVVELVNTVGCVGMRRWYMRRFIVLVTVMLLLVASLAVACSGEASKKIGAKTRTYYIAADPVDWDFAPKGIDEISGKPFNADENVFVQRGEHRIGDTYRKGLYREYTDDAFAELKERPEDQDYLGTLGPLIRAQVGDTIKVHFKNNADFPASMHPHGVFEVKDQPHLFGILARLNALGLVLLSVQALSEDAHPSAEGIES